MSQLPASLSGSEPRAVDVALDELADAAGWVIRLTLVGLVLVTSAVLPAAVGLLVYRLVSRAVARWVG